MYESALWIALDERIPCRGRMMAHAYREICSMLMARYSSNSRERVEARLDQFAGEFKRLRIPTDFEGEGSSPAPDLPRLVPGSFLKAAAAVVRTHLNTDSARTRARRIFESLARGRGHQPDVGPTADRWFEMSRVFQERCHDRTTPDEEILNGQFRQEVEFFEETLSALAEPAAETLDVLDDVLGHTNP
jgi:hypothetical protein